MGAGEGPESPRGGREARDLLRALSGDGNAQPAFKYVSIPRVERQGY